MTTTDKAYSLVSSVRLDEGQRARLKAVAPRMAIADSNDFRGEALGDLLNRETTILYAFRLPKDTLERAPELRWLQLLGAGCEHLDGQPIMNGRVAITTASGVHATPIAEYVLGVMLGHYRWLFASNRAQFERRWTPQGDVARVSRELRGRTIGIVGYGSIGREIARLAKPFGTRIVAVKRDARALSETGYAVPGTGDPGGELADAVHGPEALLKVLPECDVIVLAVPSTPETRGMIGARELNAMRPASYLINIARGDVVDERALLEALKTGRLAGAALDVFEEEPLPSDHAFWALENVLVTPHISGASRPHLRRVFELFVENLERFVQGKTMLNLVEPGKGY